MTGLLLAATLLLSAPATSCRVDGDGRRCVTVSGRATIVCVTSGVTRTCTHYRDGRPVRHCVRIGGRNRCHAVRIA